MKVWQIYKQTEIGSFLRLKGLHTLSIVKHALTVCCALTSANTVNNYYYH